MKDIIYILGAGRSGSTLLDIVLGNMEGAFSAGELNRFTKRSGIPHDAEDPDKKVFWAEFKTKFERSFGFTSYKDLYKLSCDYEYHSAYFKKNFINKNEFNLYKEYNRLFFEILSQQIDENYIIDSSKYPMRGYYLNKIFPGRVKYIYLKRRPADVVKSFAKKDVEQPHKSWIEANLYLAAVNFIGDRVFRQLKKEDCKCVEISYDAFLENPIATFELIGKNLEINVDKIITAFEQQESFKVGYLFDGNRLRKENEILLRNPPKTKNNNYFSRLTNFIHQKN